MKIIHTSDWHLGQQLHGHNRQEEHQRALDWLARLIEDEGVDLLIVAGDIFDVTNPPIHAREMYYRFLERVTRSRRCRVVITGGNHDSPATLHLADEFLNQHGIWVVGAGDVEVEKEILEIRDEEGRLMAVVAAVPFLRDSVLLPAQPGEDPQAAIERRRANLRAHYRQVGAALEKWGEAGVPLLATGHLYVAQCDDPEAQDNIYMGDKANMEPAHFPEILDYVALGHIHKPQALDTEGKIRYSGSLIPLSFSETPDDKLVWLLEFDGRTLKSVEARKVPLARRLKVIQCRPDELSDRLAAFAERHKEPLEPWVWIKLDCREGVPAQPLLRVTEASEGKPLRVVNITLLTNRSETAEVMPEEDLRHLQPAEVFNFVLTHNGIEGEEADRLRATFKELLELHQQKDKN